LVLPSRTRRAGEKIKTGGSALKTLKKLKGDKLTSPWALTVETKATGRGATALCKICCTVVVACPQGSHSRKILFSGPWVIMVGFF
jgi:hypothetical protein